MTNFLSLILSCCGGWARFICKGDWD